MTTIGFSEIPLQRHYDSDQQSVMDDFYRPLLTNACSYSRAVGYFSAGTLLACARELATFIGNAGEIRLVVGCFISEEELASVPVGDLEQSERLVLRQQLEAELKQLEELDLTAAAFFAKLVSSGIAKLRFAVRTAGIYHEKFGVFVDAGGQRVAFIGSANETLAALTAGGNHESISVFSSLEREIYDAYGMPLETRFEDLWQGKTKLTRIYEVDDESKKLMHSLSMRSKSEKLEHQTPALPELKVTNPLREYQREALKKWERESFRGMLAMATGTGKTLTAIEAVKRFREKLPNGAVVITVPYQNLAVQWITALREQGLDTVAVFDSYANWFGQIKNIFLAAQLGSIPMPCLVCVNDTFKDERFQELLDLLKSSVERHHFLIVDECHHFNGLAHLSKLPSHFTFRLGLSATPYDQFSEHYLDRYFGGIVYEFSLGRAISEGYLTKYDYQYREVELNEDETEEYERVTLRIVQIAGREDGFSPETIAKVQPLLLRRARIVGAARNKLNELRRLLLEKGREPYSLFYCGDGSLEEEGENVRQIELVTRLLHDIGWTSSRITARESLKTREALLEKLKENSIDSIVSIKVLDEGIDIPVCRSAYLLASQSSDRQGIQRRGRVLRKSPGKELAHLCDFIVVGGARTSNSMRNLAAKEIRRALQFSADATNADLLIGELRALQKSLKIPVEGTDGNR